MRDIWASSAQDVYVVGHNNQVGWGTMYHYDGQRWTPVRLLANQGGTIRQGFRPNAVYGFSRTDVYAVGQYIYGNSNPPPNFLDSSLIMHFDGVQWRDVPIHRARALIDIRASSPQDIWAVGSGRHSIYRYNNGFWNQDSVRWDNYPAGAFAVYSIVPMDNHISYAFARTHINEFAKDAYYFFQIKDDSSWTLLDSAVIEPGRIEIKWGYSMLWKSPGGRLLSIGHGVYEWKERQWIKILESDMGLTGIFGTSEKNIFAVGEFGSIYHYNGTDWYRFTEFPPTSISLTTEWFFGSWSDGKEIFIVGEDSNGRNTLILHGR